MKMSQRRMTMLEAAKFFNLEGAEDLKDNELHMRLAQPVAEWITYQYKELAPIDKIMYSIAYVYAYPQRGQLNPGLREVIHLTSDANTGIDKLDKLLQQTHEIAVAWDGRKNTLFNPVHNALGKFADDKEIVPKMIYYLVAWEPVSIMNRIQKTPGTPEFH